jgi:hypothetical protein
LDRVRYDRPHIPLPPPSERPVFTSPGSGPRHRFDRAREEHADLLSAQLAAALAEAQAQLEQLDGQLVRGARGVYLEIYTRAEWFMPEHFEMRQQGILLASAVPLDEGRLRVTVFVPYAAFDYFQQIIAKYRDEETPKGNPAHAARIERIDEIQFGADLKSLWTDPPEAFPIAEGALWWEAWLFDDRAEDFAASAVAFAVELKSGELRYPGLVVRLVRAPRSSLEQLSRHTGAISELRRPTSSPMLVTRMEPLAQAEIIADFLENIEGPHAGAPAMCILDTGVNDGHPLLRPAIDSADILTWRPQWGSDDRDDHGTAVASMALYGDLRSRLGGVQPVRLPHAIESVKIYTAQAAYDGPELYGAVIKDSVAMIEAHNPHRRRLFTTAIMSDAHDNLGLPSEWSAELDRLAAEKHRLFVVAGGNVDDGRMDVASYPLINDMRSLSDPGQSWNAITVGGYTERTGPLPAPTDDFSALAPRGGLSPTSRTAVGWDKTSAVPLKPDVLCEAGNYAYAPGSAEAWIVDAYSSVASAADFRTSPLRPFAFTSAAAAELGFLAGSIVAEFPLMWPETVRALVIHSAEWTPFMREQLAVCNTEAERLTFMQRFGHGVPSLTRALHSADNDATMIAEGELRPYRREDGAIKTNEAVIYDLPWPAHYLEQLGELQLEMKVTLSYFIDPNPGRRGWRGRYSYPSHGLRFKVKRPDESRQAFLERINREERDEDYGGSQGEDNWDIGRPRDRGSIHSDIWRGRAADLARTGIICIHPVSGWWRYLPRLRRWDHSVRYALVTSLRVQDADIDIYTAIINEIPAAVTTEIELE